MIYFLVTLSFSLLDGSCDMYTSENCESCVSHYKDRNCGWCRSSNKCVQYKGNETDCDLNDLYYNHNAKCNEPIPPPSPTPWPHYDADPTFCYQMKDNYCTKCVSANISMSCGWCHTTKECIMGDALGPFFLTCDEWSFTEDNKCTGKISKGAIIGLRVGIGVAIAIIVVLAIFGCYKVIKSPHSEDLNPTYEIIKNSQ